jgi:hypothetical protein
MMAGTRPAFSAGAGEEDAAEEQVACPCEGDVFPAISWSHEVTTEQCLRDQELLSLIVTANGETGVLELGFDTFFFLFYCTTIDPFTGNNIRVVHTKKEYNACKASLLDIAHRDGVQCN